MMRGFGFTSQNQTGRTLFGNRERPAAFLQPPAVVTPDAPPVPEEILQPDSGRPVAARQTWSAAAAPFAGNTSNPVTVAPRAPQISIGLGGGTGVHVPGATTRPVRSVTREAWESMFPPPAGTVTKPPAKPCVLCLAVVVAGLWLLFR